MKSTPHKSFAFYILVSSFKNVVIPGAVINKSLLIQMNWAALEMTTVNKKEDLSSRLMFQYKCLIHVVTETSQTMLDKEPLPCCEFLSKNLCHSRLLRYHLISFLFCCHCKRQGLV